MQIFLIFQTIIFHQFLPSEIHFAAAIFVCLPMSLYQLVEPAIVVTMMMAALQWNDEVIFWSKISHLVAFLAEFPFIKFMKTSSLTRDDVKLANEW